MEEDSDPFSAPETAHPRALDLMQEKFFWDCVDEEAPFGSDEGHDASTSFVGGDLIMSRQHLLSAWTGSWKGS